MQGLEVSGSVLPLYGSLGVKGLSSLVKTNASFPMDLCNTALYEGSL